MERGTFIFLILLSVSCFALPGTPKSGISICDDTVLCVSPFVTSFTRAAQSSKTLSNVFDISQTTPSVFKDFLYNYIYASASHLGVDFPDLVAKSAAYPIGDYFDFLVAPAVVKVFANAAANYLQSEGLLNPTNAAQLGLEYAKCVEEIAKDNVLDGQVETKMKALADGYEKFLKSVDLLVADKGASIASNFATAVKLVGEELRKGVSFG